MRPAYLDDVHVPEFVSFLAIRRSIHSVYSSSKSSEAKWLSASCLMRQPKNVRPEEDGSCLPAAFGVDVFPSSGSCHFSHLAARSFCSLHAMPSPFFSPRLELSDEICPSRPQFQCHSSRCHFGSFCVPLLHVGPPFSNSRPPCTSTLIRSSDPKEFAASASCIPSRHPLPRVTQPSLGPRYLDETCALMRLGWTLGTFLSRS